MRINPSLSIGDAVEVMYDQQGNKSSVWRPATVNHVDANQIGVTFTNYQKLALPVGSRRIRKQRGLII